MSGLKPVCKGNLLSAQLKYVDNILAQFFSVDSSFSVSEDSWFLAS